MVLLAALLLAGPAHAEDEAPEKRGFWKSTRYALGVNAQAGGGVWTASDATRPQGLFEVAGFEFRSTFAPWIGTHTVLNLGRTVVDAARGRARLDYDCYVAFRVKRGPKARLVAAPGFGIAYTFDDSPFARYVGQARIGFDWETPGSRHGFGVYGRPFWGWRIDEGPGPDGKVGGFTTGVMLDLVWVWHTRDVAAW